MEFIGKLPRQLSREALVLLRRLKYLESAVLDNHTQLEMLVDVADVRDFVFQYFKSYDTTASKFVLTYERYELERLMEENDDSEQDCSEEDD